MRVKGDRLVILTNGGDSGVLAVDELAEGHGQLAALSDMTIARLNEVLPAVWSRSNPVDILGDASGKRYAEALEVLLDEPEAGALLVINCPTAVADSLDAARSVTQVTTSHRVSVLNCWLDEAAVEQARRLFATQGLPFYETPEQAVRAFAHLWQYRHNQALLMQTPSAFAGLEFDQEKAEAVIETVELYSESMLTPE